MLKESKPLRVVFSEPAAQGTHPEVGVSFEPPRDGLLKVRFEVRGALPRVNAALRTDKSQWGLWDWDVVELFVSANDSAIYYEFQLSPLDQFFELEIFEPRVRINKEFVSNFVHAVEQVAADAWKAVFKIPLAPLGWDGKMDSLRGNAFAILGPPGARSYLSLNLPKQAKPDFHLPQYFKKIF
ncbi:MAG: hypothetical protein HY074_09980 [Deltaproteobacteria bacterium]|nr:hypothetical protein [Deltaproteobacteria bacterium]